MLCFEEVLDKARARAPVRYILLGSFFFSLARSSSSSACFWIFLILPCFFRLLREDESDDNYYCDNSHPNHIIGINFVYPHSSKVVGQIFNIHVNIVPR
jgi:hypothetical protein